MRMPLRRLGPLVAILLVAVTGCGKKAETKKKEDKPKDELKIPAAVNTGPGTSLQYDNGPKREPLWSLEWKEAQVRAQSQETLRTDVKAVSGALYKGGKEVSRYRGDGGFGDKAKNLLVLRGNVQIVSTDPKLKATLLADEIRYDGNLKMIQATGNVRISGDSWSMDRVPALWATPDLTSVGTPDMFKK